MIKRVSSERGMEWAAADAAREGPEENQPVLKRRLIFDPLPEPEPLQTGNRADLPSSGAPVVPLLHRRPLLLPEPLVNTKGVGGVFV